MSTEVIGGIVIGLEAGILIFCGAAVAATGIKGWRSIGMARAVQVAVSGLVLVVIGAFALAIGGR